MNETPTETPLVEISHGELYTLAAARRTLRQLAERAGDATYAAEQRSSLPALGRLAEACDMAEHAIFRMLNVAKNYCDAPVSRADLHLEGQE